MLVKESKEPPAARERPGGRGVGGRGLTWRPWGLRTSKLPESPSVPCFFPLLLVWDEITVSVLRECPTRCAQMG